MIRFIAYILSWSICLTFASHAVATELIVGVSTGYPPYYYERNGKLTGICIDTVDAVAKSLNVRVTYKVFPWKRLLIAAKNGDVDAIMPLFRTPAREEFLYFTGLELAYETNAFFVKKGFQISYNGNFDSIAPHRIGVITEYSYGSSFDKYQHFEKVFTENEKHLITMFNHGRFDVGVGNTFVVQFYTQEADLNNSIEFLEPPITRELLYLGFSRVRQDDKLAASFATSLRSYRKTEQYRQTMALYGLSELPDNP